MSQYLLLLCCLLPFSASADVADEPSVEANIRKMDTDQDGQVSMSEIKGYLQKQFGKEYKSALLDKLEARADAKSCGSPFSKPSF